MRLRVPGWEGIFGEQQDKSGQRITKRWDKFGVGEKARELIGMFLMPDPHQWITAADAMVHPWIAKNEDLSDDHLAAVHLNLQTSTEKRKFRRTVLKVWPSDHRGSVAHTCPSPR